MEFIIEKIEVTNYFLFEDMVFWRENGFEVIAATYYDAPLATRAKKDIEAASAYSNVRGAVYTTWRNDYSALSAFSDLLK